MDAPKSALEIVMERLRKNDADAGVEARPLTDEQKAALKAKMPQRGERRKPESK